MRALLWTDVNLEKGQLRVERNDWQGHVSTTKGGRLRYVPMTRRLQDALRAHRHLRGPRVLHRRDGTNMTASAIVEVVVRAAPRAIQELAGHRDLATTQRYMHLSPAAVQSAIQLLEQPATSTRFGDILETGQAAMER